MAGSDCYLNQQAYIPTWSFNDLKINKPDTNLLIYSFKTILPEAFSTCSYSGKRKQTKQINRKKCVILEIQKNIVQ